MLAFAPIGRLGCFDMLNSRDQAAHRCVLPAPAKTFVGRKEAAT
jgi:hypothetical protein